jgi:hypothetical protein
MKLYIYAIPLVILLLAISVNAYSYKIPICTIANSTDCVYTFTTTGVTGNPALVFYQDGHLYVTNESGFNFSENNYYNITNITYINASYFNITNITTYHINNSNGSSFIFQNNITLNKSYVKELFDELYNNTSNFYNKTQSDSLYATQVQFNGLLNNVATLATKGELVNLETRLNVNDLNNINWSSFNLTKINEYIDNDGGFNITWKTIIVIEGIIIILLLLFVIKTMMSGDY